MTLQLNDTVKVKNILKDKINFPSRDSQLVKIAKAFTGKIGKIVGYDEDNNGSYSVEFTEKNELGNNWLFISGKYLKKV